MKVLQILPKLDSGGVERGTVEVCSYLISQGHTAIVVSSGGWRQSSLEKMGARHIRMPVHSKNPLVMLAQVPRLARLIEELGVDIVHARSRVPGWIGYHAVRWVNRRRFAKERYPRLVNFVTTCHGLYSRGPISWVMGMGRRVITPSRLIADHMHSVFGVPKAKIVVIPRGVEGEEFPKAKEVQDPIFLIVSRITPNKGIHIAIEAFAKVVRNFPTAQLWIAGDVGGKEKYYSRLRSLITRFSLGASVRFLGPVKDVAGLLAKAYAVLVPSMYPESFGRAVLEAWAVGRPVIASDLPALNELIAHSKTGLLARPGDPADWAEKMGLLIRRRDLASALAERGVKESQRYSLEEMCERTLKVYEEVYGTYAIGVVKTSSFGDVVLATYSFESIRRQFPGSDLVVVGSEYTCDLWGERARDCDGVDGKWLRRWGPDVVFDLQGKVKTQLLTRGSGAYRTFGYARKLGRFLYTDPIDYVQDFPLLEQVRFLRSAGVQPISPDSTLFDISDEEKEAVRLKLLANLVSGKMEDKLIGVVMSSRWRSKSLEADQIIRVITGIARELDATFVLLGVERDRQIAEGILNELSSEDISVVDLVGKLSVRELLRTVAVMSLLITPDSALMHLGFALRVPTVVYFGPTSPQRHVPLPPERIKDRFRVVYLDTCAPCYKKDCPREVKVCMEGIEPRIVEEALELSYNIGYEGSQEDKLGAQGG